MVYNKDYKVDIPHYYCIEYSEGDHLMKIEIDVRDPIPYLDIAEVKAWALPYEKELLTKEKRQQILDNVYDYLTRIRGFKVEINRE